MRFLVTGGAGYIGSHMVKYLQERNFKVDVIDNFSTGNHWALKNCNVYEMDLLDINALDNILSKNNYNAVFHFAAKSIVSESLLNEEEYFKNNVVASKNLLDGAIKYNIKNFIFSSSASVFGSINLAKVYDLSETAAKFLADKRSFIHFEMPNITENFAKIFAAGTARLKMTHLKSLNGSDEHLAFAKYLKDTRMIIHCFALSQIDDRILSEIPDFKQK